MNERKTAEGAAIGPQGPPNRQGLPRQEFAVESSKYCGLDFAISLPVGTPPHYNHGTHFRTINSSCALGDSRHGLGRFAEGSS
jgi:hypothetical protein